MAVDIKAWVEMEERHRARESWLRSFFPVISWIRRYNTQWFVGDITAGLTIAAVVVPQGMAYAILAGLEPQFGLYSSFMGVLIYWLFATSKDITIGPVAVVSVLVRQVVDNARLSNPGIPSYVVGSALALAAGVVIFILGICRLGRVVDFIPTVCISAFMSGSAISIAVGQLHVLLGIKDISISGSTFRIFCNTIANRSQIDADAMIGLSALLLLYTLRELCKKAGKMFPNRARLWFFVSTLRTVCVISLYTTLSFVVNHDRRSRPVFSVIKTVPAGLQHFAMPVINADIVSIILGHLPATVLVLVLEHIAIAKSFGRINNYTIDSSQELIAIGLTNILGSFLGAYPATGSFSRTAIKSKSGVKTPFASFITAIAVLIAIYTLPGVFFYIPNAALAAVIIHAVLDLITMPKTIFRFWTLAPAEVPIFVVGILTTIFLDIDKGFYATVVMSLVILFTRLMYSRILRQAQVEESQPLLSDGNVISSLSTKGSDATQQLLSASQEEVDLVCLKDGVFVFTPSSSLTFINANSQLDSMAARIRASTHRTTPQHFSHPSQRPWNDLSPLYGKEVEDSAGSKPLLRAIIMDMRNVHLLDLTAIMRLLDVQKELDAYASPVPVMWRFANIANSSVQNTLAALGFLCLLSLLEQFRCLSSYGTTAIRDCGRRVDTSEKENDITEEGRILSSERSSRAPKVDGETLHMSCMRKERQAFFHKNLVSALNAVMSGIQAHHAVTQITHGLAEETV